MRFRANNLCSLSVKIWLAASLILFHAAVSSQITSSTDELTGQWLAIDTQTRKLQNDWREQKPILQQRINLLKAQRKQLLTLAQSTKKVSTSVEEQREVLLETQNVLEANQNKVEQALTKLALSLAFYESAIPPPVAKMWQDKHSLEKAVNAQENRSNALQASLKKINALLNFNKRTTVETSLITLENGEVLSAMQLYLGSSAAWFITPDKSRTGIGKVVDNEWRWVLSDPKYAFEIERAMQMISNKALADYIRLPLTLPTSTITHNVKTSE